MPLVSAAVASTMDAVIRVEDVERRETRAGHTRYIVRDDQNHEYVTFRPQIGEEAEHFKGRDAHIEFHEEQKGEYTNVYLDAIEGVEEPALSEDDIDAEIVGWQTAAEIAPLIVDVDADGQDEIFEQMRDFKNRVAADIRHKK
jgi:hypothetical protein